MRFFLVLLVAGTVLAAVPGVADPLTPFEPGPSEVTLQDALPHFDTPGNRSNEFFTEWWAFVFALEGDYKVYVSFLITNLGVGDGKGKVTAELTLPDGQQFKETVDVEPGAWSAGTDAFRLTFGENTVAGPLDGLRIRLKNSSFQADLQLTNLIPPWKPGTGRAQFGARADQYYKFQLLAPAARVEGTAQLEGDAEVHALRGLATVDHHVAAAGLPELPKHWLRVRTLDAKTVFFLADLATPPAYGGRPIRFAALWKDGQKVFDSVDFRLKPVNPVPDAVKSEYRVARLLEFEGTSGDLKFHGAIKGGDEGGRTDFLAETDAATRFVVSKFARPMLYDWPAAFAVRVEADGRKDEVRGRGRYYQSIFNP